jgi:hypothetical protein
MVGDSLTTSKVVRIVLVVAIERDMQYRMLNVMSAAHKVAKNVLDGARLEVFVVMFLSACQYRSRARDDDDRCQASSFERPCLIVSE